MMQASPPRQRSLAAGLLLTTIGIGLCILGAARLAEAQIGPALAAWVGLPLIGAPLALWSAYQLYGILTAEYRLDRESLRVRWGLIREQIPLSQISKIERASKQQEVQPPGGLGLPGVRLGSGRAEGAAAEYFATDLAKTLLVHHEGGRLAITPGDPDQFLESFVTFSRMGSLERAERRSERPDLLPAQIWSDRPARTILLVGVLLPLSLLLYLAVQAPALPDNLPFGFRPSGEPGAAAPTGRLLLLPFVGGLVWLADFLLGAWFYRRGDDRPLAYALWALAVVVGGLLWAAGLFLVTIGHSA